MRTANLNAFIPSLILAEALLSTPFMLLVTILAMPFKSFVTINAGWLMVAPQLLIFLALIFFFLKYDISPIVRKPERERRYRIGHWLLAVMHIIALIAVITPIIISKIYNNSELTLLMWFAIPIIGIGFFVWAGGLFMVWSSRA